jgi:hypothetical protein
MVARCRPGVTGADLAAAHEGSGEPLPPMTVAYGVGLGHEGPIAGISLGRDVDRTQTVEAGMVVALRTFIPSPVGGCFGEEIVHVGDDRTEVITRLGHGPLAADAR